MSDYDHLTPDVAAAMTSSKERRMEMCQSDVWIQYTGADHALRQMDALLQHPRTLRMPNLLLVARSGNGKSSIVQHFANRHPIEATTNGEPLASVLRIEMPESPDEGEFWSLILWAFRISHPDRQSAVSKKMQAKRMLQFAQTKLLIIDEFNNLANAGKTTVHLLGAIKGLSNDLKLSMVAAGTQAAINALNADPQMKSRFSLCPLHRWRLDPEYLRFLASYERLLPLAKPSQLAGAKIAPILYGMGGEMIGNTVRVLKMASVKAIEVGEERITEAVLSAIGWTKPGDWDGLARSL